MPPVKKPSRVRQKTFLREWRKFRGYSQESAAEMVGMSRENLGRIESGLVPYNQDVLEQLAEAYSCEVADLVMRDPSDPDGIWSVWQHAKPGLRQTIVEVAKTIAETEMRKEQEKEELYRGIDKKWLMRDEDHKRRIEYTLDLERLKQVSFERVEREIELQKKISEQDKLIAEHEEREAKLNREPSKRRKATRQIGAKR